MHKQMNIEKLQDEIIEIWENIPQDIIDSLCKSFRHRLLLCLKIGGKSISQYLSSHKSVPNPCDIIDEKSINTFNENQDSFI